MGGRIGSSAVTPTPRRLPARPSRRTFLAGAGTAGVLLAAGCASSTTATSTTSSSSAPGALNMALRFDPNSYALAGIPQRLVVSLLDNRGEPPEQLPRTLDFQLRRDGVAVGDPIATVAHDDGVPVAYFPVRTTIDEAGSYTLTTTVDGVDVSAPMMVSDATTSLLIQPGQALPKVDSPTLVDARGVDPICTRLPEICPYHEVDLATALDSGTPTVLLVSTPQFCQIGVCGPVLNLIMEAGLDHPTLTTIHAEVFATPEGPAGATAPVVDAVGLTFEPSLFVVGADGIVTERLDIVFDRAEIAEAFATVAAP